MTDRQHPLITDDTYDETTAFRHVSLRDQVANRLADVLFGTDDILMLIDAQRTCAPRDVLDLAPDVRALYQAANDLMGASGFRVD